MKKLFLLVVLLTLLMVSCATQSSVEIVDTPIVEEYTVEVPTAISPTAAPSPTAEPPTAIPEPTVTPEPEKGTYDNPLPFFYKGDGTHTWAVDDWRSTFTAEVGFLEILWGQDAWLAVQSANRFNDPPDEGMEYLLVKLWIKNIGDTVIEDVSSYHFGTLSDGNFYEHPFFVMPDPVLRIEGLFPDGEIEGWVGLQVRAGDSLPLFAFGNDPMEAMFIQMVRP